MCDIEALVGGQNHIQHWFDNEEREYIISAMKNRQDAIHENSSNAQIWASFMSVSYILFTVANSVTKFFHMVKL